jgi:hypothetical protein
LGCVRGRGDDDPARLRRVEWRRNDCPAADSRSGGSRTPHCHRDRPGRRRSDTRKHAQLSVQLVPAGERHCHRGPDDKREGRRGRLTGARHDRARRAGLDVDAETAVRAGRPVGENAFAAGQSDRDAGGGRAQCPGELDAPLVGHQLGCGERDRLRANLDLPLRPLPAGGGGGGRRHPDACLVGVLDGRASRSAAVA